MDLIERVPSLPIWASADHLQCEHHFPSQSCYVIIHQTHPLGQTTHLAQRWENSYLLLLFVSLSFDHTLFMCCYHYITYLANTITTIYHTLITLSLLCQLRFEPKLLMKQIIILSIYPTSYTMIQH